MNYIDIQNTDFFQNSYSKIEELKKDFPVNHGFIHIKNVIKHKGIVFLIIRINSLYYLLDGNIILNFINKDIIMPH